ncbi:LAMI_0D01156g1_1 [Lachancea mirantina]|uniref:LAMI_0D01156g1_1 n=1 Tax=Lachancea mirantina TaxID=1230905 RepID=A0A1G4J8K5_9SACH|nr:LAMI_0D01156g1_1 [Lachancea mirantina]
MQNYNYHLSFWDEQDNGVRILLDHVAAGIESCKGLATFFEERSKLERDYARRLSAVANKMRAGLESNPDFGKLDACLKTLHVTQEKLGQAHGMQALIVQRDGHAEMREFTQSLQARYKTISTKIRNLRDDKVSKRHLCEVLREKLDRAEVELRDCQLNQHNTLGKRDESQNDRQFLKWKSIVAELQSKSEVLKQEYRASSKHWLQEWSRMSLELQDLEKERIEFVKLKMQQFAKACGDAAVEEQISMDKLTQQLAASTADQDIAAFAYDHGTGRLKTNASSTQAKTRVASKHSENMRHLSSRLQKSRLSSYEARTTVDEGYAVDQERSHPKHRSSYLDPREHVDSATGTSHLAPPAKDAYTSSESSQESSNPTDFTSGVRHRTSAESMSTSISSLANSIEDSQRFAKSWNSQNRRKSKTQSQLLNSGGSATNYHSRSSSTDTTRIHKTFSPSTSSQRRKSMVWSQSAEDPLQEALETMRRTNQERLSSSDSRVDVPVKSPQHPKPMIPFSTNTNAEKQPTSKRVMDSGHVVELPLKSSQGENVLRYARALYTYLDANEQQIVNFQKGDYLLLTEQVDQDWFIGEVYASPSIDPPYRIGIVPRNYIELLT